MKKAEPKNHKKKWTLDDYARLDGYLSEGLSLNEIAEKLGRTEISIEKALPRLKKIIKETEILKNHEISNFPAMQKAIQNIQLSTAMHRRNIAEALNYHNFKISKELDEITKISLKATMVLSEIENPNIQMLKNLELYSSRNIAEIVERSNQNYAKIVKELSQKSVLEKITKCYSKIDASWSKLSINEALINDAWKKILEAIANQSSISLMCNNLALSRILVNPMARFLQHEMTLVSSRYSALMSSVNSVEKVLSMPNSSIPWAYEEMVLNAHTYRTFVDSDHDSCFLSDADIRQEHIISLEATQRNLEAFNPALGIVHSGLMQSFSSTNPDKTRHIFVGLRTIWERVLTEIAPTKETMSWLAEKKYLSDEYLYTTNGEKKPTRWAKLCYVFRHVQSPELLNFVQAQIKMVIDLIKTINRLHDINTRYADDEIKLVLSQNSSCLNFIFDVGINTDK
jgi:predicted DNA-binding protein YlxM (UPF0122 family)